MSSNPRAIPLEHRTVTPALLLAMLLVASIMSPRTQSAWADGPSVLQLRKLPEGEITAVGSTTLDLAGRFYGLHPKLTIVNDEGKPMELKQLRPGLIVQYHVKEGVLDQIIVLMPR